VQKDVGDTCGRKNIARVSSLQGSGGKEERLQINGKLLHIWGGETLVWGQGSTGKTVQKGVKRKKN